MIRAQYIVDVLTLDYTAFDNKYPQRIKDKRSFTNLKRYYQKKVNAMETPRNPEEAKDRDELARLLQNAGIDVESIGDAEVGFHVGFIRNADGEIEYTKPLPSFRITRQNRSLEDLADVYEPATPANIHPTKRQKAERASKFILAYGDGQVGFRRIINSQTQEQELVPLHNVPMHRIIQQVNADLQPETTVNLGDFADMTELSRFDPDSDHFHKTLGPSMQWIHDFYAQLVADNPNAEHWEVDSNHAIRPRKKVLKQMPELYDFYLPGEDYPMISYYRLANLGKLGIKFISGYGAAELPYGTEYDAPPIIFKHGNHSSSNPGTTVSKEAKENPETNVVRGHGHSHELVMRTMRNGHQLFYVQLGSSCMNTGPVPGYDSAVDDKNQPVKKPTKHQNTFLIIEDFQNGFYNLTSVNVMDGKAFYNGKEYNGNE